LAERFLGRHKEAEMTKKATLIAVADRVTPSREDGLRQMLEERRRDMLTEVKGRLRGVRTDAAGRPHHGMDQGETGEAHVQHDIEFALIQMKAEILTRINEALSRLEEGSYGYCCDCGEEIAEPRLRALPFAGRCRECEESREVAQRRERVAARRGVFSLLDHLQ
jgi:DnaK suppressor protein